MQEKLHEEQKSIGARLNMHKEDIERMNIMNDLQIIWNEKNIEKISKM
jgi:hypothetical protein